MTAIQQLVRASARFIRIAPADPPAPGADVPAELLTAYRAYRYWQYRVRGQAPAECKIWADDSVAVLASGWFSGTISQRSRRDLWDGYRADARWWAERPGRIKAQELAYGTATPVR